VEGYALCYNNAQDNSGGHKWRLQRAQDDDQEVYLGLWPKHQLSHGRTHTVFIHKRFFLQAFLDPRRQDDMFPLWSTDQLDHMMKP